MQSCGIMSSANVISILEFRNNYIAFTGQWRNQSLNDRFARKTNDDGVTSAKKM